MWQKTGKYHQNLPTDRQKKTGITSANKQRLVKPNAKKTNKKRLIKHLPTNKDW